MLFEKSIPNSINAARLENKIILMYRKLFSVSNHNNHPLTKKMMNLKISNSLYLAIFFLLEAGRCHKVTSESFSNPQLDSLPIN